MIKNKLPLGTKVEFTAVSESRYELAPDPELVPGKPIPFRMDRKTSDRKVVKTPFNGSGIICGVRFLQEGWTTPASKGYEDLYADPPEWNCTNTVDVYLVAISYARLVRVQPEDIKEVNQ
jgi:hypothetical protein